MLNKSSGPADGSTICIGCGFCCDATLHPFSELDPGDEEVAIREGLGLVDIDGKKAFAQPCPKFDCGQCSIYDRRPQVCRTYRCQLRIDVDEGRMSVAEAKRHIGAVKDLVATLMVQHCGPLTGERRSSLWQELRSGLAPASPHPDANLKRLHNLGRIEYLLGKYFRRRKTETE